MSIRLGYDKQLIHLNVPVVWQPLCQCANRRANVLIEDVPATVPVCQSACQCASRRANVPVTKSLFFTLLTRTGTGISPPERWNGRRTALFQPESDRKWKYTTLQTITMLAMAGRNFPHISVITSAKVIGN